MMFRRRIGVLGLSLLAAALSCTSESEKEKEGTTSVIKLGAILDRTGSSGTPSWTEAAKMAVSHLNDALKAEGKPVRFELLAADSKSIPDTAVAHAREFVDDGAKGLLIDLTANYTALMKLQYDDDTDKHLNVPIVGIAATSPAVLNPAAVNPDPLTQAAFRDEQRWSFRTTMSTAAQGLVMAQILKGRGKSGDIDGNGKVKLSIVLSNDPYGQGSTGAVKGAMAQLLPDALIETVAIDPMVSPNDIAYYGSILDKALDSKNEQSNVDDGPPDMIISAALPDFAISFTKSYAQSGSDVALVNMGSLRSGKAVEALGSDANGKEGCSVIQTDTSDSGDTFKRDFRAWTDSSILANFDASAYDAVVALGLAALIASNDLEDASTVEAEAVRDAVRSTSEASGEIVGTGVTELGRAVKLIGKGQAINYEGASGPVDFDESGNTKVRWVHFFIKGGSFQDDVVYDCVESATCEAID